MSIVTGLGLRLNRNSGKSQAAYETIWAIAEIATNEIQKCIDSKWIVCLADYAPLGGLFTGSASIA